MLIISWNVNSVRARLDRLLALLERHQPDLVCLQETKCADDVFPREPLEQVGYVSQTHGQKTYNGVALLARQPLQLVEAGFAADPASDQARVICGQLGPLTVVNSYVVNGKALGTDKYELKLRWLDAWLDWVEDSFDVRQPLLMVGDFNIAPGDRDVYDPSIWHDRVLVSEPERERLRRLLQWGARDLFRELEPQSPGFTWWDYRAGSFPRDRGLRIDLALGTDPVRRAATRVWVDRDERKKSGGPGAPSDHAPLLVELDLG